MATIIKRGRQWRAQVRRCGVSRSASFATKAEAAAWALEVEAGLADGRAPAGRGKTLGDLLREYAAQVSPGKRGERWERIRCEALAETALGRTALDRLDGPAVARWRDARLDEVAPGTVLREWGLMSAACTVAVREWHWLAANPFAEVRRPAQPASRERLMTDDEVARLLVALGYSRDDPPVGPGERVGAALLFAIETAMRAGELCGLAFADIVGRVAHLPRTKNGASRAVPLSTEALRIVDQMRSVCEVLVFDLTPSRLDALFRKAKARAGLADAGLHFHDSRATAITRLAKKLGILDLARMVGHRDLRMLQVYYRESAADIAERLD